MTKGNGDNGKVLEMEKCVKGNPVVDRKEDMEFAKDGVYFKYWFARQ